MIVAAARTIRLGLGVLAVLAVPGLLAAGLSRGTDGLVAVGTGLGLVALFFTASKVAVSVVARRARALVLPAALGTYLAKVVVLGALLVSLEGSGSFDLTAFAWAIFAGVFGWLGAELWVATHTRVPFYDPDSFRADNEGRKDRSQRDGGPGRDTLKA